MKIDLNDIKIGKRVRKEIGDLTELKSSLQKYGLINPIVINSSNELISGFRRICAARELGWINIEARIMNPESRLGFLELEMHENIVRKDFTIDELREGMEKKKKLLTPNIFIRIWNFIKRLLGW
jgi:ParB family chromosome partitioning protein